MDTNKMDTTKKWEWTWVAVWIFGFCVFVGTVIEIVTGQHNLDWQLNDKLLWLTGGLLLMTNAKLHLVELDLKNTAKEGKRISDMIKVLEWAVLNLDRNINEIKGIKK